MIQAVSLRSEVEMLKTIGIKPRLHPNGFIQLDMGRTRRLHIWPEPKLPAQATKHPIHDHAFDMESTVILGRLYNITYDWLDENERDARARLHQVVHLENEETVLQPTAGIGRVRSRQQESIAAGESYDLRAAVLHDSVPVGLTATVMTKTRQHDYMPVVVVPIDVTPDNAYKRSTVKPAILWDIIEGVLAKL